MSKDTDWTVIGMTLLALGIVTVGTLAFIGLYTKMTWRPSFAQNQSEFTVSMVSGTEYHYGDPGQVIVEVRDMDGTPLQSNCTASVWYPNKTAFVSAQSMVSSSSGNSYITFTVPRSNGVYEYQANCTAKGITRIASKSFHVSPPGLKAEMTR